MSTPMPHIPRQFGKTLTAKQLQADMERVRRERELARLGRDLKKKVRGTDDEHVLAVDCRGR